MHIPARTPGLAEPPLLAPVSATRSSATTLSCPDRTARSRVTYADYTASGRALTFIEDFIREQVLPRYGNTHTESSGTGRQTTRLREDARHIIRYARSTATRTPASSSAALVQPGSDRPADRHPGSAHPVRPRGPLSPLAHIPAPNSARLCSPGLSSTTPTSCLGVSRSPTSYGSLRTPTATSTKHARTELRHTPTGRC